MPTVNARIPIRDGFTLEATYSPRVPNIYNGVQITYRPGLSDEVADFMADQRKFITKWRELAVRKLVSWNISGDEPESVLPINADTIKEIPYSVLDWIVDCICGYAPRQETTDAKN